MNGHGDHPRRMRRNTLHRLDSTSRLTRYVVIRDRDGKWEIGTVTPMQLRDVVEHFLAMLDDGDARYTGIMLLEREQNLGEIEALCERMNGE